MSTIVVKGEWECFTLSDAVECGTCHARIWPPSFLEKHMEKHEMPVQSIFARAHLMKNKWTGPLVALLLLVFSGVASGQYIRTLCSTLTLPSTAKATCFDYTDKRVYYWNGSAWVLATTATGATLFNLNMAQICKDVTGCTLSAANFTAGNVFRPVRSGLKTTGIRFFWPGGVGALTVKLTLRTSGSPTDSTSFPTVVEAITSVAVNAAAVVTANFASELTLVQDQWYVVTFWEDSGSQLIGGLSPASLGLPAYPFIDPSGITYIRRAFVAGDANPTSNDQTVIHPIAIVVSQ